MNKWTQARDRLLQHRVLADDIQELFGRACAAAWPETRAASSGEDHSVNGEFL
jgi:hypothetical protein